MSTQNRYPPHKHWSGWPDDTPESDEENATPKPVRIFRVVPDEGDLPDGTIALIVDNA